MPDGRGLSCLVLARCCYARRRRRTWTQGEYRGFRKGRHQEPLGAQRRAADAGAAIARAVRHRRRPTSGRWRRIRRAICTRAAAPTAKLYRIPPDGKGKMLADLDALEIHAIAVDSKDRVYVGHVARRQGLPRHRQRQAGGLLRPQGEVHLGDGVRQQGRSVRRDGRPGRDPSRDAGRQGQGLFQER